jgi:para-nitrobenzyl esterase
MDLNPRCTACGHRPRGLDPAGLMKKAAAFNQSTVDGSVLPESQIAALSAGHVNRVPVIQSVNSHEARFLLSTALTEAGYQATAAGVAAATGKPIDRILARYPVNSTPFDAASDMYGDAAFACTAEVSSLLLSNAGMRTHLAHFDDPAASFLGAMHTAELKYLFNLNLGGSVVGPSSLPAPSQALATTMRAYWTRFASSGNPNSADQPEWRPISDGQVQSLVAPVPSALSLAGFSAQHHCDFWN